MYRTAIIGASGFTGAELLRICAQHPDLDVIAATGDSQAGTAISDLYPSLAGSYADGRFVPYSDELLDEVDLVFMGLPHGASQSLMPSLRGKVGHIVDLAADFRLNDPDLYPTWYGQPHTSPDLLDKFVYGMPELFRSSIVGAELIAAPGVLRHHIVSRSGASGGSRIDRTNWHRRGCRQRSVRRRASPQGQHNVLQHR